MRRRLDRAAVVEAAEVLVDRDGWAFLTMTALAADLGVRGPSLYSHVDSIEALLGLVQNLLDLENAPNYWIDAIDGGVILFALVLARLIGGEAAAE